MTVLRLTPALHTRTCPCTRTRARLACQTRACATPTLAHPQQCGARPHAAAPMQTPVLTGHTRVLTRTPVSSHSGHTSPARTHASCRSGAQPSGKGRLLRPPPRRPAGPSGDGPPPGARTDGGRRVRPRGFSGVPGSALPVPGPRGGSTSPCPQPWLCPRGRWRGQASSPHPEAVQVWGGLEGDGHAGAGAASPGGSPGLGGPGVCPGWGAAGAGGPGRGAASPAACR